MDRATTHLASLTLRTRIRLAQARRQRGLPQIYTLAVASKMLREQLDVADRQLQTLILRNAERDHLLSDLRITPETLAAALDEIADLTTYFGEGNVGRQC
jgi:hypothetical protein